MDSAKCGAHSSTKNLLLAKIRSCFSMRSLMPISVFAPLSSPPGLSILRTNKYVYENARGRTWKSLPLPHYVHGRDWYMGHFHLARSESEAICCAVIIIIKLRETPIALIIWRRAPVGGGGGVDAEATSYCILFTARVRVEQRIRFLASHGNLRASHGRNLIAESDFSQRRAQGYDNAASIAAPDE